ncbi:MAG TPA: choice-of-anchor Q domain-containing protein [Burkholderiaceae bacterium]
MVCWSVLLSACGGGQSSPADTAPGQAAETGATAQAATADTTRLSVVVKGTTSDTVSSSPGHILCTSAASASVCSESFRTGATVTLSATAGPGEVFVGWSGGTGGAAACNGSSAATCALVLDAASRIVATFQPRSAATLKVSVAGGGTVSSTGGLPDVAGCGNADSGSARCSGSFAAGATATMTATPATGYHFVAWWSNTATGGADAVDCAAATTCSFTKTAATQYLTAVFARDGGLAPLLLYQDILSGPLTGGEGDHGIYLSLFGKNFGSAGLGTTVKVYLDHMEVASYKLLAVSHGRTDIQQVTVQPGALDGPAALAKLPVDVVVDGWAALNPSQLAFTANPGHIFFVDPVAGVDTTDTSSGGSFAAPFKTVQKPGFGLSFSIDPASQSGAYGRVQAGDFIVLRGGTYTGVGFGGYFMQALNKSGCPLGTPCPQGGGASSGPITVMGYPGETAFVDRPYTAAEAGTGLGAFSSADSARQAGGYGAWWNVVGVKIESGFADGSVNTQLGDTNPLGSHWRVVNDEMTGVTCQLQSLCRGGGVAGNGEGNYWVGNYVHDIYDAPDGETDLENHGVYIGGGGSYEVAYNRFSNIAGGNGIQTNDNGTASIRNVSIHHNLIDGVGKHGINIADAIDGIVIHDNVVANANMSGLRFNSPALTGARVYNNTFYGTDLLDTYAEVRTALQNDGDWGAGAVDIRNNIFVPGDAKRFYMGGNVGFTGTTATLSNNLWFDGAGTPGGTANVLGDPLFVSPGTADFHVAAGSPAVDAGSAAVAAVVKDDYDTATATSAQTLRPQGAGYDIGAYER